MIMDWKLDETYCAVKKKIEGLEIKKKATTNEKKLEQIQDELNRIQWYLNIIVEGGN